MVRTAHVYLKVVREFIIKHVTVICCMVEVFLILSFVSEKETIYEQNMAIFIVYIILFMSTK